MKKPFSFLIPFVLIVTIAFFSLNSCSKNDEVAKTDTISLTTEKSQYAPYEIVTILAEESVFSPTTPIGKINNIDVELTIDDAGIAFVLPNLENGNYTLSFSLGEINYNVPIKVLAQTSVLAADTYFSEITADLSSKIAAFSNHINELQANEGNTSQIQSLQDDLTFFQNQLNSYVSQYSNLSLEEKAEFAKAIAANKNAIDEFDALNVDFTQSTIDLRAAQTIQDYENQVEVSKAKFVVSVVYTVGHIPFILAGGKVSAATGGNPAVLLGLGVVVTSFMINVLDTATMAQNLTNKSLKPYEFIMDSGQKVFQTGIETVENAQAKYRSLINSDGGNATIAGIVTNFNLLKDKYNSFRNFLPSILRPSYVMNSLKNTFNSTTRSIYNQYVSISALSNSNVILEQINQPDGSIKVKATTTSSTDQDFTYRVNYSNSNFANNLNKTVSAKVMAVVDSIEVYRVSALGNYSVNGWVGNGPNSTLYCELKEGGVATYTIFNDPSWPDGYFWNVSWSIQKQSGKYYYSEYGWWNGYPNIKIDSPLSYPVTSFNYHNNTTYTK